MMKFENSIMNLYPSLSFYMHTSYNDNYNKKYQIKTNKIMGEVLSTKCNSNFCVDQMFFKYKWRSSFSLSRKSCFLLQPSTLWTHIGTTTPPIIIYYISNVELTSPTLATSTIIACSSVYSMYTTCIQLIDSWHCLWTTDLLRATLHPR